MALSYDFDNLDRVQFLLSEIFITDDEVSNPLSVISWYFQGLVVTSLYDHMMFILAHLFREPLAPYTLFV